jgi:uncharacterized coiled-coil protein SlyX
MTLDQTIYTQKLVIEQQKQRIERLERVQSINDASIRELLERNAEQQKVIRVLQKQLSKIAKAATGWL